MPVTYDASFRLAVVALARIEGAFAAARMAKVSVNTVKEWMSRDEGAEPDEAEWDAAQKLAQSRHLQALISGKVTGVGGWAMSSGISARNRRMLAVQRRWDARKATEQQAEAEPERNRITEAVDALRDDQTHLLATEVQHEIAVRTGQRWEPDVEPRAEPLTDEQGQQAMLAFVAEIAALPPEQVAERQALLDAHLDELDPSWNPKPPPVLIDAGSPEGTRARLARDVTPGAPQAPPVPEVGRGGVWRESSGPVGEEWQWEPWARFDR